MNLLNRLVKEEEGQALTEYGLIIGLIAVVCIAAVGFLGGHINRFFTFINGKLNSVSTPS